MISNQYSSSRRLKPVRSPRSSRSASPRLIWQLSSATSACCSLHRRSCLSCLPRRMFMRASEKCEHFYFPSSCLVFLFLNYFVFLLFSILRLRNRETIGEISYWSHFEWNWDWLITLFQVRQRSHQHSQQAPYARERRGHRWDLQPREKAAISRDDKPKESGEPRADPQVWWEVVNKMLN